MEWDDTDQIMRVFLCYYHLFSIKSFIHKIIYYIQSYEITGIIPFSCPRMFSGESCLRCRVCFVCFEGWFFGRVIKILCPFIVN